MSKLCLELDSLGMFMHAFAQTWMHTNLHGRKIEYSLRLSNNFYKTTMWFLYKILTGGRN